MRYLIKCIPYGRNDRIDKGTITYRNDNFLLVETSGIGFKLFCTKQTIAQAFEGESIFLHTQHIVREDGMFLYGFEKLRNATCSRRLSASVVSDQNWVCNAFISFGRNHPARGDEGTG
jgi:hypothetical protein